MSYLLIIGAKSDIAKELAKEYSHRGYDLFLAARKSKELQEFAKDLSIRTQRDIKLMELDILRFESHRSFYNSLPHKPFGVISAVGYLGDQKKGESDFREARKIIDTNYTGVVSLLNIIADDFSKRGSGFIVGISSVAGDRGRKKNQLYGSAKAGLSAYLSGLRNRLHDSKVHVLTVKPGFVATKMTEGMDLPSSLTARPSETAKDIYKAQKKGKNVIYTKWIWCWIMMIVNRIPERIFKKMNF